MGWAGGSELAGDIWDVVRKHIPESNRRRVALTICQLFEDHDCDTLQEAEELWEDAGLHSSAY